MRIDDIKLLYEYNAWANKRILAAAEKLSAEQLAEGNVLGWGSLHGALVHILDAEYGWRRYLNSEEGPRFIVADDCPDLASLRRRWRAEDRALFAFLDSLTDEDLQRTQTSRHGDKEYRWLLWHCLVHVVNHGTQHRSECAAILTGFGQSPGDMDLTLFIHSRETDQP